MPKLLIGIGTAYFVAAVVLGLHLFWYSGESHTAGPLSALPALYYFFNTIVPVAIGCVIASIISFVLSAATSPRFKTTKLVWIAAAIGVGLPLIFYVINPFAFMSF